MLSVDALMTLTASAALLLDLHDALLELDILQPEDMLALGIERASLLDIERRVPLQQIEALWALAHARGAPGQLGLLVGQQVNPQARGVLAHLVAQAGSLGEALQIFQRHMALMSEGEQLLLEPAGNGLKLIYGFTPSTAGHRFAVERSMSAALTWARALTGMALAPLQVGFRHDAGCALLHYQQVFGAPVLFAQASDYLLVSAQHLALPLNGANPYLKQLLSARVEALLQGLTENSGMARQVRNLIDMALSEGQPSVGRISAQLNMSRQTLHRRLQAEGLNYRGLLAAVRRERALMALSQGRGNLDALSQALGYSELSAFFKAFKRWYGLSPRRYQQDHLHIARVE